MPPTPLAIADLAAVLHVGQVTVIGAGGAAIRTRRFSQRPVHPSEQPTDADCDYGGGVGLCLDGAT